MYYKLMRSLFSNLKQVVCIFFVQLIAFQLPAEPSHEQGVSEVEVSLELNGASLREVFSALEQQTDFVFVYSEQVLANQQVFTYHLKKVRLEEVLADIAHKTNLKFRQINETISVSVDHETKSAAKLEEVQQLRVVSGQVVERTNGSPLPGVTVLLKGTSSGVITDSEGRYRIEVPEGAEVLVFSFVGFVKQEVNINQNTVIDIQMEDDVQSLDELVVVGYGIQKKADLTGSVAVVDMKKLQNRPITNSTQALQGVTGLYVNQAGGQPGKDGATIRIRGLGSFNNNDPLVLVDGIEYPLSAVNPNDIESISVLKDAASAAIYGNRAANGVVLVTTKHGNEESMKIEYNNYFGVQTPTYLPDLVTDPVRFMELRNQAQTNAGISSVDYSDDLIAEYKAGESVDPYVYPQNNWLNIMFHPAFMQQHNLRFSGGSKKTTYSMSMGYLYQDGILMSSSTDRISVSSNINFKAKEWLEVGANISAYRQHIDEPTAGVYNVMQMTFKAQGFHPTYLEDGRYANTFVLTPGHNVYRHPIVLAKEGFNYTNNLRSLLNLYTNMKLPLGFEYKAKVGVNILDGFTSNFVPEIYYYQVKTLAASTVDFYTSDRNRHLENTDNNEMNLTVYHTLNWTGAIHNQHHFKALLGNSYESFYTSSMDALIEGFLGNDLTELNAGSTNPSVSGTSSKNILIGYFGRFDYDYQEKYLFEANVRYDGSSRFAEGNRWGFFPSFSAGWRLDQENFLSNASWLSMLKLRGSYGQLGNQNIGNFKYVNLISTGYDYSFGGSLNSGAAVSSYNDPNISWEKTAIANVAIEASFMEDRYSFTLGVYDKVTSDILRQVDIAAQIGNLGGPVQNIGKVSNKGIELTSKIQNNIGNFFYGVDGGINLNANKVLDLKGQDIYSGNYITREGYPIDSYYILKATGIFQTQEEIDNSPYQNSTTKPGYIKFKDQNGDGVIDEDDRIVVGGVVPKYTYNFSFNVSYKAWTLTGFFQGVKKINTYPQGIVATPFWYGTSVTKEWVNHSWTPERPNASLPIMTTYESSTNDIYRASTFWLKDASYLRLKNIQLTFNVPQKLLSRVKVKNLSLFVNGQNLITFSKMKDFDPEKNITNGNYYEYPSVKTYSAGMNVTF